MNKKDLLNLLSHYPYDDTNKRLTQLFVSEFDNFWSADNIYGHVTASAWVINQNKNKALLTHHLGLDRWFQLGGHVEKIDNDIFDASLRELKEESGLSIIKRESNGIFDIDIHKIPASIKKQIKEHFHFDIRILYSADENEVLNFDKNESNSIQWLTAEEILSKTQDESVVRMLRKTIL